MALRWELRDDGAEIVVTAWGVVTEADAMRQVTDILRQPDVMRNERRRLPGFSGSARVDVPTETVHTIARAARGVAEQRQAEGTRPSRVAVAQVAANDVAFGLMRMFEFLFGPTGWRTATFRDLEEARAWLARESP